MQPLLACLSLCYDIFAGFLFTQRYAHYDGKPSVSDFKPFGGWSKPFMKQFAGLVTVCGKQTSILPVLNRKNLCIKFGFLPRCVNFPLMVVNVLINVPPLVTSFLLNRWFMYQI